MLPRCSRLISRDFFRGASPLSTRTFTSTSTLLKSLNPNRKPRNNEIKLPLVQLVDPVTQKLQDPAPPSEIVAKADMKNFYVELVSQEPPIVRLVNRKDAHVAKLARKAKLKQVKVEHKELQMTWNVADTDVAHKLRKAREHLAGGNFVDIAFAPKARQPKLQHQEMVQKMELVVETLKDVADQRQDWTLERNVGVVYLKPISTKTNRQNQGDTEN